MDEEAAIMMKIGPNAAKYAKYPDDLVLVSRFASLLAEMTPAAADKVQSDEFYKTVLQAVRLMHLCGFNYSDVVVTLAYGSNYFCSTFKDIGHMMSSAEAAHVGTLLIFLAHSFVLDETCPLRCWQRHIFRNYCSLTVLDAALFRLFNLQGFHLRLTKEQEQRALSALLHTSGCLDSGSTSAGVASALAAALDGDPIEVGLEAEKKRRGAQAVPALRKGSPIDTGMQAEKKRLNMGPAAEAAVAAPGPGSFASSPPELPGRVRSGAAQGPRGQRQPKGQRGSPEDGPQARSLDDVPSALGVVA